MNSYCFKIGDDIANLKTIDRKRWYAISMPTTGVRFDARTLELLDTDKDGRIRTPEILAAIEFLQARQVDLNELFNPPAELQEKLADILARQADLAKTEPSAADKQALADWEAQGKTPEVAILGEATPAANAALAAVEGIIDTFFTPPEDMPLVTEEADVTLPLKTHLNPKHVEAILAFAEQCVKPLVGEVDSIDRLVWKKIKTSFAPYRAWVAAKPVMNAGLLGKLEDEEREVRYRLYLLELLENYVTMRRLYAHEQAIFQTGILRIDAKELNLCFHVESEAAHAALSPKSNCCVLYLKLSRPAEGATRQVCAVVTAGHIGQLYVGRNGVFYDRDGKDWEAVITKIVENEVSLMEAFWSPWRKLGEGVSSMVKKFLGDKQAVAQKNVASGIQDGGQANGAAMASSIAAIGIGIGMMGTAIAAIMAAVRGLVWWQWLLAIGAVILVVSLPSVILTWFKLRRRDIGAILNACGWAVNRQMRFSMHRAKEFTRCAKICCGWCVLFAVLLVAALLGTTAYFCLREKAPATEAPASDSVVEGASTVTEVEAES